MPDSATPWTVAHQAPLCMGFPRQEYWSGLPFPPPGHLPDPGIEPMSPASAGGFFTAEPLGWGVARQGGSQRRGFNLWVGKIPWMSAWQPTPVILPGESPQTDMSEAS